MDSDTTPAVRCECFESQSLCLADETVFTLVLMSPCLAWCVPVTRNDSSRGRLGPCLRLRQRLRQPCLAFRERASPTEVTSSNFHRVYLTIFVWRGADIEPVRRREHTSTETRAMPAARLPKAEQPSISQWPRAPLEDARSMDTLSAYVISSSSADAKPLTETPGAQPEESLSTTHRVRQKRKQTQSRTRAATMRARWADPMTRTRLLQSRQAKETVAKQAAALAKRWQDPAFRARMKQALKGRRAWNQGKQLSAATRERIRSTMLRLWSKRRAQAALELAHPHQDPPEENAYQRLARQYEALAADLRIWSDGFYVQTGRRPRASDIESAAGATTPRRGGRDRALNIMQPALVFKCRRFLELKRWLQDQGVIAGTSGEEIIRDDVGIRSEES